METHTSHYEKAENWSPPLTQQYEYPSAWTRPAQPPVISRERTQRQREGMGMAKAGPRMPKVRAVALARAFKRGLVVTSLAIFASFSGLVAFHQVTSTASQQSASSSPPTPTSTSSSTRNSFFNQQGGNTFGTGSSTSSGGSASSSSSSTSSSGSSSSSPSPVSGSHVS
jgi:hypothetical protein